MHHIYVSVIKRSVKVCVENDTTRWCYGVKPNMEVAQREEQINRRDLHLREEETTKQLLRKDSEL